MRSKSKSSLTGDGRNSRATRANQITMDLLVQHLREIHAAPPKRATEGSEMDLLRLDYQTFLLEERSLFHSTCAVYLNVVRRFLARCFPDGKIHLNRLQAKDVVDFVLHDTSSRGSKERRLGTPFPEKSLGNEWQKLETKSRRNGQCNGHLRRIGSKSVPRWHPGVAADKDALREAVTTGYLKSRVMI